MGAKDEGRITLGIKVKMGGNEKTRMWRWEARIRGVVKAKEKGANVVGSKKKVRRAFRARENIRNVLGAKKGGRSIVRSKETRKAC